MPEIRDFHGEYRFLSNFYERTFHYKSDRFGWVVAKSVEHVYQAEKAAEVSDFFRILGAATPGSSKRMGRGVLLRSDWEEAKFVVMWDCLWSKFSDPDLSAQLRATGNTPLVEGNRWHDNIWGDCSCGREACQDPGTNFLGMMLGTLRGFLLTSH